jgi:hypothetical protein
MEQIEDTKGKLWKDERIILLEKIPGKNSVATSGLVDNRLFEGKNTLKAFMEPNGHIWGMKYEAGAIPEPLKQKFTSFTKLLAHAEGYFAKRGIRIAGIVG